jgi:hypothetical protein
MFGPAFPVESPRAERGAISWVTLLLLVILAGGGYLGWVWLPVYFELYTVKAVVRDYMNQAIKNPNDEALRRDMVLKIRSLAEVAAVDARGRATRAPAIPLEDDQVRWERNATAQPPTLRVAFKYERQVLYPILDRADVGVLGVDLTGDLTRADWGPSR